MTQPVPLHKQSKKAQRAYHAKQRGSWNGVNPVTRTIPNKKAYNRNRQKQTDRTVSGSSVCFFRYHDKTGFHIRRNGAGIPSQDSCSSVI